MAGTVKVCVPELVFVEELVVCGELCGCVAVTEGVAVCVCVAESAGVGDDAGVLVSADVGDAPGVEAKAAADPFVAPDAAAEGFDPLAPHALRPAPQMTAAMITAGTRHILMLLPSGE
jgi:hypothetical protein